jgi:hypothetical protein
MVGQYALVLALDEQADIAGQVFAQGLAVGIDGGILAAFAFFQDAFVIPSGDGALEVDPLAMQGAAQCAVVGRLSSQALHQVLQVQHRLGTLGGAGHEGFLVGDVAFLGVLGTGAKTFFAIDGNLDQIIEGGNQVVVGHVALLSSALGWRAGRPALDGTVSS